MVKMNKSSVITTVVVEIPTMSEYEKVPDKMEQTRCSAWIAVEALARFADHTKYDSENDTVKISVDKTICPILDRGRTTIELKASSVELNPWEFSRGKNLSLWLIAALLMGGITTSQTLNEPRKIASYLGVTEADIPEIASCGRLKARYFRIIAEYICDQLASKHSLGADRLISYINLQMCKMDGDIATSTQPYPKEVSSHSQGVVPAVANDTNPEISTR
jgi:hypothetical protein